MGYSGAGNQTAGPLIEERPCSTADPQSPIVPQYLVHQTPSGRHQASRFEFGLRTGWMNQSVKSWVLKLKHYAERS